MKKQILLSVLFIGLSFSGFSTVWTITNSGFTFTPATITINPGDSVQFSISSDHNAVEVSQATYNANMSTPLPGGFSLPFGGGQLLPVSLPVGTHYYVCTPHASMGMKGIIIVNNTVSINDITPAFDFSVFPNPTSINLTLSVKNEVADFPFEITDFYGKKVYEGRFSGTSVSISVADFPKGMYLITLGSKKERSSLRWMKN